MHMREAKQKAARFGAPAAGRWCRRLMPGLLGAGLLAGCANDRGPHPELPRVGVSSGFTSLNLCSNGVSPAIYLTSPPAGTATYRLKMTMANALVAPSWQFDVPASAATTAASGSFGPNARTRATITQGAIADFPAPCPPERQVYVYRVEVLALAADGRSLGYGWGFASAQSLARQLSAERNVQLQRQKARDEAAARGLPPPAETALPGAGNPKPVPYASGSSYPPETSAYFFVY